MATKKIKLKNAAGDYLYPYTENLPTATETAKGVVQLDKTPTENSTNALTSGAAKTAFDAKLDKTGTAAKATADAEGNVITTTYATKTELSGVESIATNAKSIAEGRSRASSFSSYSDLISALNTVSKDAYKIGDNLFIQALNVPDLWIYTVEANTVQYSYTTDDNFISEINQNGSIQIGYFKVSIMEAQKLDLTDYVPSSRTINNKSLAENISLTASDIGALSLTGTAAKATADAEGNEISSTYAKLSDVISYEEM